MSIRGHYTKLVRSPWELFYVPDNENVLNVHILESWITDMLVSLPAPGSKHAAVVLPSPVGQGDIHTDQQG